MKIQRQNLGDIIRRLVTDKGLSDAKFAEMIGMKRQNVKKTVFEKHSLDTDLLCTISEVLECNLFDYFKSNPDDDASKTELRATLSIEMGQERQDRTIRFVFGNNDIEILDNS